MLHTPRKFRINRYGAFKLKWKSIYGVSVFFPPPETPPGLVVRHLCRAVSSTVVPSFCQPRGDRRCVLHVFQEQCLKQCIGSGFHWDCIVAVSPVALLIHCKNNSVLNPLGKNICQQWLLFYIMDISCRSTEAPQDTDAFVRATNQLGSRDNGKGKSHFQFWLIQSLRTNDPIVQRCPSDGVVALCLVVPERFIMPISPGLIKRSIFPMLKLWLLNRNV